MQQLGESLAGRVAILELLPFSGAELAPPDLARAIGAGGYPIPARHPERSDLWARSDTRTYLQRDVRQVSQVTDLRAFERFLGLAAAQHGQELTKARLARDCGESQLTIANWLGVLEGWVVIEAVKAFTNRGRKPDLNFWRSHDGLEADLLIQAGTRLHPIEIQRTATPTPTHVEPLTRLRALVGDEAADEPLGLRRRARAASPPGLSPGDEVGGPGFRFPVQR